MGAEYWASGHVECSTGRETRQMHHTIIQLDENKWHDLLISSDSIYITSLARALPPFQLKGIQSTICATPIHLTGLTEGTWLQGRTLSWRTLLHVPARRDVHRHHLASRRSAPHGLVHTKTHSSVPFLWVRQSSSDPFGKHETAFIFECLSCCKLEGYLLRSLGGLFN